MSTTTFVKKQRKQQDRARDAEKGGDRVKTGVEKKQSATHRNSRQKNSPATARAAPSRPHAATPVKLYTMADQRLAAKLVPGTRCLVDGFAIAPPLPAAAYTYFLTHAHSDHTIGEK